MDREAAIGSSNGMLFMALFGAVWGAAGAGALGGVISVILLVVSFTLAAVLCLGAVKLRRGARSLTVDDSPDATARQKRLSQRFNLVFGLEGITIALAVVLLGRYGLGTRSPSSWASTSSQWPTSTAQRFIMSRVQRIAP